jgi:uncharacterized membrane protein
LSKGVEFEFAYVKVISYDEYVASNPDKVTRSETKPVYWGLAAILLLAAGLRLYRIDYQNIWLDEAYSAYMAQQSFSKLLAAATSDIHPPLYYLSLKSWIALFGLSPLALRSLSVLFSLLIIWLSFLLARRLVSDHAALLVALLLALSPHQLFHAQEARMYPLVTVLTLAMTLCYWKLRETTLLNPPYVIGYVLFATLALYTHYVALLIIGAINAHFFYSLLTEQKIDGKVGGMTPLLRRRELTYWLLLHISIVLLFSPWLAIITQQLKNNPPLSWRAPATLPQALAAAGRLPLELTAGYWVYPWDLTFALKKQLARPHDWSNLVFLSREILLIILGGMALALLFLYSLAGRKKQLLALTLLFIPLTVATAISLRGTLQLPRYLTPVAPYFFILLSSGLAQLKKPSHRLSLILVLIAAMTTGLTVYYSKPARDSDYRPVLSIILSKFQSGDAILPTPYYMSHVLRYYFRQTPPAPAIVVSYRPYSIPGYLEQRGISRAWVVLDYRSPLFSQPSSRLVPLPLFYLVEEHAFPSNRPQVRLLLLARQPRR